MRLRRTLSMLRASAPLATALAGLAIGAGPGSSQASRVGVFVGATANEQEWSPTAEVEGVAGFMVGAFLDAATPVSGFSILAEGALTQRGGDVVDSGTAVVEGAVRTEYLSVSVRAKLATGVGPAHVHVAAGPAFENVLRSRVSPGFETILEREGQSVFGVLLGAGVDVGIGQGRRVGVEARLFDGLSDAYDGDFVSVRNRSWEAVVRFGIPIPR